MFKDNVKAFDLADMEKPKLYKGHTTIELKNVKTGVRDRIESDNTFQSDVLTAYLRSMGVYNNNPWDNSTFASQRLYRNLVGGIFLFKDSILPGTEYMPAGNKMTANGAFEVSSTSINELGSYNDRESVIGTNSLTFVYDWGTSQGNGDISCVCLTSEIGGYIGYGNPRGTSVTGKDIKTNQSAVNSQASDGIPYKNMIVSFSIDDTNHVLTVTKKRAAITKASIFDGAETTETYSYSQSIAIGTGAYLRAIYAGSGKFILFYFGSSQYTINAGVTAKYLVFDIEAQSNNLTVKSFTNNTGSNLALAYGQSYFLIGANETSIFVATYASSGSQRATSPIYQYAIADGSLIATYTADGVLAGYGANILAPGLMMFNNMIIDTVNGTVYPANLNDSVYVYNDSIDGLNTKTGVVVQPAVIKNPLYLATINNLQNTVEKNSTQTMKVTYTLTEVTT